MAKKTRSAAQRAATKRMIAANRARRSGGAKRRPAARKPARRRAAVRSEAGFLTTAPARRRSPKRRAGRRPVVSAARASRAGRTLRYRRKNPIGLGGVIGNTIVPSAVGAGGALLLDVAMGLVPLPAAFKAGAMAPVVRVAGAIGLGMLAQKVVGKRTADQLVSGAVTVTLYQLARGFIARALPGKIPGLSDYGDIGEYVGEYVGDAYDVQAGGQLLESGDDLGYINSGVMVGNDSFEGFETGVYR